MQELYQLKNLKKEIDRQNKRLKRLRAQATALSGNPDGMPRADGELDKVGAIVTEIATLDALINDELARYWREYVNLEMYIANIPDSFTRDIFRMRFIDGYSWGKIAYKCGGGQSADGVKKACYRYLDKS